MNIENYSNIKEKSPENIKTLEQLLEIVKTPEDLLDYMEKNIKYGFVSRKNAKIYSSDNVDFDNNFFDEYFLQTPDQLLISKQGVCFDQTELEREWFLKQEYEPKVFFLIFAKEKVHNLPAHTFLVYKNNNKFYWFENSFYNQRGIHEYEDLNSLIEDVKNKQFEFAKKEHGAVADDFKDIKICEYEVPEFGCNLEEFVNNILDKNFKNRVNKK